jgi:hypothetical protein
MAFRGKKKQSEAEGKAKTDPDKEKEIENFIKQGGSSYVEEKKDIPVEDPLKNVQLRVYQSMIQEIDTLVKKRPPRKRISRHQWILDAIEEKKEREQDR